MTVMGDVNDKMNFDDTLLGHMIALHGLNDRSDVSEKFVDATSTASSLMPFAVGSVGFQLTQSDSPLCNQQKTQALSPECDRLRNGPVCND